MLSVAEYQVNEVLHREKNTVLYRAQSQTAQELVLIKTFQADYPTPRDVLQLKREYEVTRRAASPGVLTVLALEPYQQTWLLKLEDCGGLTLEQTLAEGSLNLFLFFEIAIALADVVMQLHRKNIIHKDIKPANILVNQELSLVKLTNFASASLLSGERSEMVQPDLLEGSLPYMAPEQTGRLNRPTDFRSDLYSVGVTFYEMLTGVLPFRTTDPVQLIYQHLTVEAVPPMALCPELPSVLSAIVCKCLAKNAEDRYQSAYGLKRDLEACWRQFSATGKIENVQVGEFDRSEQFRIPDVLYGREREIQMLGAAFDRARQGGYESVLVTGTSGLGKSTLGQEFKRIVLQQHGFFLMGKFEQRWQAPYQGLLQALQQLVYQLLVESDESIANWRERIGQAVGSSLGVLTEALPALELIVGAQLPVAKLPAEEESNRFRIALQNLLSVFATEQHPVVFFLDDLQEADQASMKWLDFLISDRSLTHFLLIGTCRADEMTVNWMQSMHQLQAEGMIFNIPLSPLTRKHVSQMLQDTLRCTASRADRLAQVMLQKGDGNPLFVKEFLQTLHAQGYLRLAERTGEWMWNLQEIQKIEIDANQIDFLLNKILQLPDSAQHLVKVAACLGSSFDLQSLHAVLERDLAEVASDLLWALEEAILLSKGPAYKWLYGIQQGDVQEDSLESFHVSFQFVHDRVQQAAYRLLTPEERKHTHLQMGRRITGAEHLFERVHHLNEAVDWITDEDEREELAGMNLEAGRRLKTSTAYEQSLCLIKQGIELLRPNCWDSQYELAFDLHKERFELEYLCGDRKCSEEFFVLLVSKSRTILEKSAIYIIKIRLYSFSDRMSEALQTGEEGLRALGYHAPLHMSRAALRRSYQKLKARVQHQPFQKLIEAPMADDPIMIAQVEMMNVMGVPSYHIDPALYHALRIKMIESSFVHGLTEKTGSAYVGVGVMVLTEFGDYATADALGRLGVAMEDAVLARRGERGFLSLQFYANEIQRWTTHNRASIESLWTVGQLSLKAGSLMYAVYSLGDRMQRQVYGGVPLDEIKLELQKLMKTFERSKSNWVLYLIQMTFGLIQNVQGATAGTANLSHEGFDEEQYRTQILPQQAALWPTWYYYCKILLLYLAGEYEQILALMPNISEEVVQSESDFPFFYALTFAGVWSKGQEHLQAEHRSKFNSYRRQLKKLAAVCPDNFLHRALLVDAEAARLRGRVREAMDLYDEAIAAASRYGYLHHAAIANECAARFYVRLGKGHLATPYLVAARYGYLQWGAPVKVKQLEQQFPDLLKNQSQERIQEENIDFLSVLKAARTISGEIVLDKLLEKLIEIVVENAGAQKVLLLMEIDNRLCVLARKKPEDQHAHVLDAIPWQETQDCSPMVIQYVSRLQSPLVLHDATQDDVFRKCAYIQTHSPKSILCLPIVKLGRMIGMIYLENSLITHSFTEQQIEVMNLLSAQMAVSIENAELYRRQVMLSQAYGRFVPHQFLRLLEKKSITDVNWGDHVEREMSVLFADIRSFTALSEQMSPEENFYFLNGFLRRMEPMIKAHRGFVDKYIGDSIMALFDKGADDAVLAGIAMLRQLREYNEHRLQEGRQQVRIGIGVNSGHLMLGTIGGHERMDSTVISDAVNVAARIEKLTKVYKVPFLISEHTYSRLTDPGRYAIRPIDCVSVRGRSEAVTLYEIFEADSFEQYTGKQSTLSVYQTAYAAYWEGKLEEARTLFASCLQLFPTDVIVQMYLERCQ